MTKDAKEPDGLDNYQYRRTHPPSTTPPAHPQTLREQIKDLVVEHFLDSAKEYGADSYQTADKILALLPQATPEPAHPQTCKECGRNDKSAPCSTCNPVDAHPQDEAEQLATIIAKRLPNKYIRENNEQYWRLVKDLLAWGDRQRVEALKALPKAGHDCAVERRIESDLRLLEADHE